MTALLQALGLAPIRERSSYHHGKCSLCGTRWWVEVTGYRVTGSQGPGVLVYSNGFVEALHDCQGGRPRTKYLKGVRARTNRAVRCNSKCTGATGHQCECSCGGRNHGRGA